MKNGFKNLAALLSIVAVIMLVTSCQTKIYQVSITEIDSIIKANGSVVIQLKEGYEVYPLFDIKDTLYHYGAPLRSSQKSQLNPLLNFNGALCGKAMK